MADNALDHFFSVQAAKKDPPAREEVEALHDLFRNRCGLQEAAQKFAIPTTEAARRGNGDPCWRIWELINDAAKQFPEYHEQLVGLMVSLQAMGDVTQVIDGKTVICTPFTDLKLWSDLPALSASLRETIFQYVDPPAKDPSRAIQRKADLNVNAFVAKYSKHPIGPLNQLERGARLLTYSLEEAPWEVSSYPDLQGDRDLDNWDEVRAEEVERRSIRGLDGKFPQAAQWILIAGEELWTASLEEEWFEEHPPLAYKGWKSLWNGKEGYSRARWDFWKARLGWMAGVDELEGQTRRLAKEAIEVMNKIEATHSGYSK